MLKSDRYDCLVLGSQDVTNQDNAQTELDRVSMAIFVERWIRQRVCGSNAFCEPVLIMLIPALQEMSFKTSLGIEIVGGSR